VSVVLTSATASITKVAETQIKADLIVSGETSVDGQSSGTFGPDRMDRVLATPGVESAFGWYNDAVLLDGQRKYATVTTDVPAMQRVFGLSASSGTLAELADGEIGVDEATATALNLRQGSTATVQTTKGEQRTYTVAFVLAENRVFAEALFLPESVVDGFASAQITSAFVKADPGTDVTALRQSIEPVFADNPEVSVQDLSSYVRQQASQLDTVLLMIQVLLALAILIAVLGVINTLALSVIERTRELGLLRAIGMRRAQVMRMITVESVVISVFGALLGLVVGVALGVAAVRALTDMGITDLGIPWVQLGSYLLISAGVGVVAAILPAIRAARLNVLHAISYE
jgi:putative ABC transport system permease protein